jgi:dTDP-4-dehydrorhamnose reductase
MKILLFGGSGQLGYELRTRAQDLNFTLVSPVTSEVDVSNPEQIHFLTNQVKPDLIINSAAYTAVDKAEVEKDLAFRINCDGARYVAEAAKVQGARFIHMSTDYVFEGSGSIPLTEEDPVGPRSVYGASKRAGEEAVLESYPERSVIIRTSSLHGQKGVNFVHTMLDLFKKRDQLKVVADQMMSPTWAGWLAEVILDLGRLPVSGILHASCAGAVSWYDFAQEILRLSAAKIENPSRIRIDPITAAEFGRPAPRPQYSVFNTDKLTKTIGRPPLTWQLGLKNHLMDIGILERSDNIKEKK